MGFLLSYGSVWCPCHFFWGGWGLYKHISEHGRMPCSKGLVFQHRARFLKEAAIVQENCQIHIPSCTSMGAKILSEVYMAVVFFFPIHAVDNWAPHSFCPKSYTTFGYLLAESWICTYEYLFPFVFWNKKPNHSKGFRPFGIICYPSWNHFQRCLSVKLRNSTPSVHCAPSRQSLAWRRSFYQCEMR